MNNQESSFVNPEQRSYEPRNINADPREQRQRYAETYGDYAQQQMGGKIRPPRRRRRAPWLLLILLLVLVLAAGGVMSRVNTFTSNQKVIETHSFANISHPKLVIQGDSGTVHIHSGGSGNAVIVQVTKQEVGVGVANMNDLQVNYTQNGSTINIETQSQNDFFFGSRQIDLDITAPNASDLVVSTGSGDVQIDNINGPMTIKTGSGSIQSNSGNGQVTMITGSGSVTASNINGQVTLKAGSGSINATNVSGQMSLSTGSGSINAGNINGQVTLVAGSGRIQVSDAKLNGQSILRTGSGSIVFAGSIDPNGNYTFDTGSGSIDATLPTSSAFALDVSSGSGTIHNDFGNPTVGNDPRAPLRLHTGSGSISLHKN